MVLTRTEKLLLIIAIGVMKSHNPRNLYFKKAVQLLKTDADIADLLEDADGVLEWSDVMDVPPMYEPPDEGGN